MVDNGESLVSIGYHGSKIFDAGESLTTMTENDGDMARRRLMLNSSTMPKNGTNGATDKDARNDGTNYGCFVLIIILTPTRITATMTMMMSYRHQYAPV